MRGLPFPYAVLSRAARVVAANAAFADLFDSPLDALAGRDLASLFSLRALRKLRPAMDAALAGTSATTEGMFTACSGRTLYAQVQCRSVPAADGQPAGLLLEIRDLAEDGPIRTRLRLAEQAVTTLADHVLLIGPDGRIRDGLPSETERFEARGILERMLGRHLSEVFGEMTYVCQLEQPLKRVLAGRSERVSLPQQALLRLLRDEPPEGPFVPAVPQQDLHGVMRPFRGEYGTIEGALLVLRQEDELPARARELERLAMEDPLTGLANRRAFQKVLEDELIKARAGISGGISLLALDLDDFKAVNDRAGHAAGDAMLCQISDQLRDLVADKGVVARLGGDEFAVVRFGADEDEAGRLAREIVGAVETLHFDWNGAHFRIGCSVGVAVLDRQFIRTMNATAADVLHWADEACLTGKATGGGQVRQFRMGEGLAAHRQEELGNVARVERALAEDELRLFALPVVDILTGKTVMTELLLRVQGDENRLMRPGAMIASAERHGLMSSVDRWVFDTALARLRDLGEPALISLNVSAQSLGDVEFLAHVDARLAETPALAGCLCFEIAEVSVARNMPAASRMVSMLKRHGCKVALDDFGGGWPSTAHLRRLDLDWLKIDGAIIRAIVSDPVQHAVLRGILCVARELKIDVIAEYVEDLDTAKALTELGVRLAQGFHYAEPAPWEPVPA
ncbi:EAL domain-containing protein [Microvirga tunisiensis]|uniref:EAL domain-containing protein n=1 Tax=Pannonibacter tanglangensis TaxID=2750084 RepID=A0A7X5F5U6_9HYPH|nr:EAL domain-containing protein [Pannonibacter sp. XCT-53]NBN80059.1 EAL domain-containing protein [Pannonibacter sp. XCT-53]